MRSVWKILKWLLGLALLGAVVGALAVVTTYLLLRPTLPDVDSLREVQLQVPLRVYTRDARLMQVFGEKRRTPVAIDDLPACVKNAFIAGEDARFYEHPGFDYIGISRAVWHLIKTGGEKGPGGSTITQQLARDFGFVSRKKLYTRKIKEIFLALEIERELSKDEILELYLNKIYLGNRAYGVGAAAHAYYGKQPEELTVAECAMLAALPKAPSRINPINNPPRALERRDYVLGRMRELGYIDESTYRQALAADDFAFPHEPEVEVTAPYAAEMARSAALELLGEDAYSGGYEVYTTFDGALQQAAASALREGLIAYDRRHGYRGAAGHFDLPAAATPADWDAVLERFSPLGGLTPALVLEAAPESALAYLQDGQTISLGREAVAWARPYLSADRVGQAPQAVDEVLAAGDVIRVRRAEDGGWTLGQVPEVEGALVSLRPADGALLALVGGFDFRKSKFNRATQARRQPGSSFKPFVYAAALNRGFTPATLVNDAPVVFESDALERDWRPENYSEQFYGPTRLREGMVNSRNLVSIRVLREAGVDYVWNYVQRFGFTGEEIPRDLSMALGSGGVFPITMARAYAIIGNGGFAVEPFFIDRIVDGAGRTVFEARPRVACRACPGAAAAPAGGAPSPAAQPSGPGAPAALTDTAAPRVMEPATNFIVSSLLQDVIRRGTGRKAMALGRNDLAGKTGTTNEQRDAWFSGFNHQVATTTWVGFDVPAPLGRGEVGGRAALPIWIDFMEAALADVPERLPEPPADVVYAKIDPDTGLLLAGDASGGIMEVFRRGDLPPAAETAAQSGQQEEEANPYDIF